jgi:hypothetical protein
MGMGGMTSEIAARGDKVEIKFLLEFDGECDSVLL